MINNVTIEGRLTKDPELRHVGEKNSSVTNVVVVCNYWNGSKEKTTFISCSLWGKQAENLCRFCKKGSRVTFNGSLAQNQYVKDGVNVNSISLEVRETSFDISKKQAPSDNVQVDYSDYDFSGDDENQPVTNPNELPFY